MTIPDKNNLLKKEDDLLPKMLIESEMAQKIMNQIPQGGTFFLIECDDMERIKAKKGSSFATEILSAFARRLQLICRDSDLIGRIDEYKFFIFMPVILSKTEVSHVVDRLKLSIEEEMLRNKIENDVRNGVSIAVVTSQEEVCDSLEDVVAHLLNILKESADEEKDYISKNESSDDVFNRVFSMKVQTVMSKDELTKTMAAMNNTYRANFFIRLKDQSYIVLKDVAINHKNNAFSYKNAQKMLLANISQKVLPEYRDNFYKFANLNTLPERMASTDSLKYEYQNFQHVWCVATFSVIEREDGIATKVIYLVSDLTHDRAEAHELLQMQKEAISLLSNSELLFISVINRENGASRVIQSRHLLDTSRIFDFKTSMQREATHLLESEQKIFLENVELEKIKEELEKNNHYVVTAFLQIPENRKYRRVSYHFSVCQEFPQYILAATEDVTEPFIRDSITGMKNFEGFKMDCMNIMDQSALDQYVVVNFNIVNFKAINTMYGYDSGNGLLKKVIKKLSESAIPFLSICRENADNFFCLCSKEDYDFDTLNSLCKLKITDDNGLTESMELFCGIYPINSNQETIDEICDKTRIARRHAEREIGVNAYVLDEAEKVRYLDEAVILASVSEAIQKGELAVYYQPIYDAKTGKLSSAEALVRWEHPEKGLIPPGFFIPAVEKTGQIVEIDLFVGQHVQEFQCNRYETGKRLVPVSINVSRYDFLQDKYMKNALTAMQKNSEIADMLRIEITESGLINVPTSGETFLHEMRMLGIQTMIDDFGTGYSSLTSIIDRPCDIIKLDISFARKIGVEKKMEVLVIASIETAHRLGVKVVAEGVETKEQYEFLKKYGCDYIQGYYFSKPLPEHEFEVLLEETI